MQVCLQGQQKQAQPAEKPGQSADRASQPASPKAPDADTAAAAAAAAAEQEGAGKQPRKAKPAKTPAARLSAEPSGEIDLSALKLLAEQLGGLTEPMRDHLGEHLCSAAGLHQQFHQGCCFVGRRLPEQTSSLPCWCCLSEAEAASSWT